MRSLTLVNRRKADFDLGGKFRGGLDVAADLVEPEERNGGFNGDWGIVKVAQGGAAGGCRMFCMSQHLGRERSRSIVLRGGVVGLFLKELQTAAFILRPVRHHVAYF